jgi:hypothetical protein
MTQTMFYLCVLVFSRFSLAAPVGSSAFRRCSKAHLKESRTFGFPLDGLFLVAMSFVSKQINVAENDLFHTSHSCHLVMAWGFIPRTAASLKPHSPTLPFTMDCSDLASSSLNPLVNCRKNYEAWVA